MPDSINTIYNISIDIIIILMITSVLERPNDGVAADEGYMIHACLRGTITPH